MTILYDVGGKLYVNLTNKCPCNCTFCIRHNGDGAYGSDSLWLEREPTCEEVLAEFDKYDMKNMGEIVFCGYGEPTMNLDALKEVAKYAKENGLKTRLNTNGLANAQYGRDIVPELVGLVDTVSISLNDCDAEKYDAVCHSRFGRDAYGYMLDFTRRCVAAGIDTVMTVVDVIPAENIEKCAAIAAEVGARFRVRNYSDK